MHPTGRGSTTCPPRVGSAKRRVIRQSRCRPESAPTSVRGAAGGPVRPGQLLRSQREECTKLRCRKERIGKRLTAPERMRSPELTVDLGDEPATVRLHPFGERGQLLEGVVVATGGEADRDHRTFVQAGRLSSARLVHRCRGLPGHQPRRSRSLTRRESTPYSGARAQMMTISKKIRPSMHQACGRRVDKDKSSYRLG
jgi:hypothetical protein